MQHAMIVYYQQVPRTQHGTPPEIAIVKNAFETLQRGIHLLDQVIRQNASAAEEMSSTAEELSAQAQALQDNINSVKARDSGNGRLRRPAQVKEEAAPPPRGKIALPASQGEGSPDSEDAEFERF